MREHADVPSLWVKICMALGLVLVALSASRCGLTHDLASAENTRTESDCLFLHACVISERGVLPPELASVSCAEILEAIATSEAEGKPNPVAVPADFVAPLECVALKKARRFELEDAKSARRLIDAGGDSDEIRKDLKIDRANILAARQRVKDATAQSH
jgi:hypothetical protein